MDENKTNTTEVVGDEQLEDVSGGVPAPGDSRNPITSDDCWKSFNGGSELRDGRWRKKCRTSNACKVLTVGEHGLRWYCCKCYGTDRCKDGWHIDSGC